MSRAKYEAEIKQKLHDLEVEVERLQAHIKAMEKDLDPDDHAKFAELRDLQAQAHKTFDQLLSAGDETFESLQSKLEEYWQSLGREIKAYDQKLKI